jgi:hypothetical protein
MAYHAKKIYQDVLAIPIFSFLSFGKDLRRERSKRRKDLLSCLTWRGQLLA